MNARELAVNIINLVIPGLLNFPVHEIDTELLVQTTPNLHWLLRYANRVLNSQYDIDQILIHKLGLKQAALPYARACKPQNDEGTMLLIKPVYLKADINNAVVYPIQDEDEVHRIIDDLSDCFITDCDIEELPDNTWLMSLHHCSPVLQLPHYLTAVGKKVTHYLDQVKTDLHWFKLFNEMQMFLYQHEINQHRQQTGLPMINSLWCWGADAWHGELLENILWFSDDTLMQRLGQLYSGNAQPLSAIKEQALDAETIIVDLSLLRALKGDLSRDMMQIFNHLETNCLQPVMQSNNHHIMLYTGGDNNFYYRPSMQWKFWKKPLSITSIMIPQKPE